MITQLKTQDDKVYFRCTGCETLNILTATDIQNGYVRCVCCKNLFAVKDGKVFILKQSNLFPGLIPEVQQDENPGQRSLFQ